MTIYSLDGLLPNLEPVCFSMSSSNCCFLTCVQVSQEAGQVVCVHNHTQYIVTQKCFREIVLWSPGTITVTKTKNSQSSNKQLSIPESLKVDYIGFHIFWRFFSFAFTLISIKCIVDRMHSKSLSYVPELESGFSLLQYLASGK